MTNTQAPSSAAAPIVYLDEQSNTQWLSVYETPEYRQQHSQENNQKYSKAKAVAYQATYQLPLGTLYVIHADVQLDIESNLTQEAIESARLEVMTSAIRRHRHHCQRLYNPDYLSSAAEQSASIYVLVVDVYYLFEGKREHFVHDFGSTFFSETLIIDFMSHEEGQQSSQVQGLQVFSHGDWQYVLKALQTPGELWRFLQYCAHQRNTNQPFANESSLLQDFLRSAELFHPAITVDNQLIKHGLRQEPNSALVTMALVQKTQNKTAGMYLNHMSKAATLWQQLCLPIPESLPAALAQSWQQQLLDESLFSRHELVRELYKYPKKPEAQRQKGYVVHQHSYESLGRHYVMVFYGQDTAAAQHRSKLQPKLSTIATDVMTRLSLPMLHHIVVLGVSFITDEADTFIELDVFVQPAQAMSDKEQHLYNQFHALKQQINQSRQAHNQHNAVLPSLHLKLHQPAKRSIKSSTDPNDK